MAYTRFLHVLDDIGHVDQAAVQARVWSSGQDLDLKRRKQAEFLVHGSFPLRLVLGFACIDEAAASEVRHHQHRCNVNLPVVTRPQWYY
jgi:hypothetical protein